MASLQRVQDLLRMVDDYPELEKMRGSSLRTLKHIREADGATTKSVMDSAYIAQKTAHDLLAVLMSDGLIHRVRQVDSPVKFYKYYLGE